MTTTEKSALRASVVLTCIFISSLVSFAIILVFYLFATDSIFYDGNSCFQRFSLQVCYYGREGVWTDSSYLQTITGFYDVVITVLVTIIAIVAGFGAYTIRSNIKSHAEQELPMVVTNYFSHIDGNEKMKALIDERVSLQTSKMPIPEQGEFLGMVTGIERRLEDLEALVQGQQGAE